jgi:tellurite resistance protein
MSALDNSLLTKVASQLSRPPSYAGQGAQGSILTVAAASYGSRPPDEEVTPPTGFDPAVAALFEAIVESAYLVANADGDFDDAEQAAFTHVVVAACNGVVAERQLSALLSDLSDLLAEDGMDKRIEMVARTISKPEHARDVLRVAALIACVSGGVSTQEQNCLARLAERFALSEDAVDAAVGEARSVLRS